MSVRRERSERSEFGDGATRSSIAVQSARSADRRPAPTTGTACRAAKNGTALQLRSKSLMLVFARLCASTFFTITAHAVA